MSLIFDLGFYKGEDTAYYLYKGFDVVAVEANPFLYEEGCEKFKKEIEEGKLVLLNNAISDNPFQVNFYIPNDHQDWGTCNKDSIDVNNSTIVKVDYITLNELMYTYGNPYYIKVDIEGNDELIVKELVWDDLKVPTYISFEISKSNYFIFFSYLYTCGYKKFQLVNQANNEGKIDGNFTFVKGSSGMFGEFLPKDKWLTFDEALTRYIKYKELKYMDNQELALGWIDLHASL